MAQSKIVQLTSVQALRGIAACLVLFFHVAGTEQIIMAARGGLEVISGFWQRGYAGVDIFFVISGFIMVYVTQNINRSADASIQFLKARALRIYPLWWVYASLMCLIYIAQFGIPVRAELAENSGGTYLYLLRSFLLLPQARLPVISVGWTLIHEMYFYVVFAVFLLFPRRFLPWLLTLWTLQICVMSGVGISTGSTKMTQALANSPLTIEFIGGAFVGLLVVHRKMITPLLLAVLSTGMFTLFMFIYPETGGGYAYWGRILVFGLPAMLMVYGFSILEIKRQRLAPKWLSRLGDWSYSLYLSHLITLLAVEKAWEIIHAFVSKIGLPDGVVNAFWLGTAGLIDNVLFALVAIFACLVVAAMSYHFIERPLVKFVKKRRQISVV